MTTDPLHEILSQAKHLPIDEQMRLLVELQRHVEENAKHRRSLRELQGLGKEIWADSDAQEYVRRERASWNG